MPAIQQLLQRWGFVQVRRYGLELTSDGRILSTRPAVLDDGTGGRIVGWQDGDVSIWKLSRWSGAPGVGPGVATGVTAPPGPPPPAAIAAIPSSSETSAGAAPSRPSARVIPAEVAGEPMVDEDDWEWTIALARARVAVEETETARPPPVVSRPESRAPRAPERPTLRSSATADLAASGDWRRTDTAEGYAYEDYRVTSRPLPGAVHAVAIPRTTTPSTVIPVPTLPTVDATRRARLEPVVRPPPSSTSEARRQGVGTPTAPPAGRGAESPVGSTMASRFAKGTGPVDPPAPPGTRPVAMIVEETVPSFPVGEHTTPGVAPATRRTTAAPAGDADDAMTDEPVAPPPPSTGDPTRPGIALPPAARTVALPSIVRRTAR
jgi:hypothetical protein